MKVTLCSWCDKPAQHKTREQGERSNSDACCDRHYAEHFAKHALPLTTLDMFSRSGRAGGKHKRRRSSISPTTENLMRMRGVVR